MLFACIISPLCRPKNPPANIGHVVQKLESDYNQMRDKILAGVPLKELKPLSVDCEKITTGSRYIPAEVRLTLLNQKSLNTC